MLIGVLLVSTESPVWRPETQFADPGSSPFRRQGGGERTAKDGT